MALKYIRILTEATRDNPQAYPLMFDVVLDTKTGRVALDDEILGRQWGLNEYDYPFVVKTNGDVTFGDEVKCEWAHTDVRDVVLKVGSVILWEGDGGYHEFFRVIELRDMLARAK
jgi:hypothetical protein